MNILVTSAIAALTPLVVGFVWYNPKVFGAAWLKSINMTEEQMKGANMAVIFGVTYLFSYMLSLGLYSIVIHQQGVASLAVDNVPELRDMGNAFIAKAGLRYNTFKHGAFHAIVAAILFALPVLGINALFERRGAKYIFIHLGYWIVTLGIMGGIICQLVEIPTIK